jgi:hypothetical protein
MSVLRDVRESTIRTAANVVVRNVAQPPIRVGNADAA